MHAMVVLEERDKSDFLLVLPPCDPGYERIQSGLQPQRLEHYFKLLPSRLCYFSRRNSVYNLCSTNYCVPLPRFVLLGIDAVRISFPNHLGVALRYRIALHYRVALRYRVALCYRVALRYRVCLRLALGHGAAFHGRPGLFVRGPRCSDRRFQRRWLNYVGCADEHL